MTTPSLLSYLVFLIFVIWMSVVLCKESLITSETIHHLVEQSSILAVTVSLQQEVETWQKAKILEELQAMAERECQDTAMFPCDQHRVHQGELAKNSCCIQDSGCGHEGIKSSLSKYWLFLQTRKGSMKLDNNNSTAGFCCHGIIYACREIATYFCIQHVIPIQKRSCLTIRMCCVLHATRRGILNRVLKNTETKRTATQ